MTEAYLYGADAASQPGTEGPERLLPAGGQARGLQPAAGPRGPDQERQGDLAIIRLRPRQDCRASAWFGAADKGVRCR